MSWQDYIDKQLVGTGNIKEAFIADHQGNIWACSANFQVTPEEIKHLCCQFSDTNLCCNGVVISKKKYIFLSADPDKNVIRARLGRGGLHCTKTKSAVILGTYEEPTQPGQAATVIERLGDYLISTGM